ncbi:MAG: M14 family zinc carboxypeptidase [bacterium]|nr:M14 family zinc carboxypeptidase [bacterium]
MLPSRVVLPTEAQVMTVTPLPTRDVRALATNTLPAPPVQPTQVALQPTALILEPGLMATPNGVQVTPVPTVDLPPSVTPVFTPFIPSSSGSNAVPQSAAPPTQAPLGSGSGMVVVTPTMPDSTPSFNDPLAAYSSPQVVIGQSVQGRELVAYSLGQGNLTLMLVGGIHGGWEANTSQLVGELMAFFEANPGYIFPGVRLILIPTLNPDGLVLGRTLEGRFNANGVDLNRNWGCGWQAEAVFRETPVNPGTAPFSEPESVALAAYILQVRPSVVLFYHSAASGIFAGDCETGNISQPMSAIYGQASGYTFGAEFTSYPVTGTASTWVDGLGIPSADVELATTSATDFEQNLRGVMALQCWLLGEAAAAIEICNAT